MDALNKVILSMIDKIGLKDDKQFIIYANGLSAAGSNINVKKKKMKEQSWKYLRILIDRKQKENNGKLSNTILKGIEKYLKQSLSKNGEGVLRGAYSILDFLFHTCFDHTCHTLFDTMSSEQQRNYCNLYPASTPEWFHKINKTKLPKTKQGAKKVNDRYQESEFRTYKYIWYSWSRSDAKALKKWTVNEQLITLIIAYFVRINKMLNGMTEDLIGIINSYCVNYASNATKIDSIQCRPNVTSLELKTIIAKKEKASLEKLYIFRGLEDWCKYVKDEAKFIDGKLLYVYDMRRSVQNFHGNLPRRGRLQHYNRSNVMDLINIYVHDYVFKLTVPVTTVEVVKKEKWSQEGRLCPPRKEKYVIGSPWIQSGELIDQLDQFILSFIINPDGSWNHSHYEAFSEKHGWYSIDRKLDTDLYFKGNGLLCVRVHIDNFENCTLR